MHKHTKSLTSEEGRIVWPFPSVNGQQTEASKALQANKAAHSAPKFDPSTCEESPL